MPGASRSYFEAANVESNLLSKHEEIIMVTNMGPDGKPAKENASLGSGEVVWHSDNSYIEEPPIGSFLRSLVLPEDGGNTSFSNQYLAYETLPSDVKAKIVGLYTKQMQVGIQLGNSVQDLKHLLVWKRSPARIILW